MELDAIFRITWEPIPAETCVCVGFSNHAPASSLKTAIADKIKLHQAVLVIFRGIAAAAVPAPPDGQIRHSPLARLAAR
jgi:hypothetical protein